MMAVWITILFLTGMISTSSSWPDFDLPDDLPDRIPDRLPDFTLPPDLFKNISISVACDAALARMFSDKRSYEATLALDACGKPEPGFLVGNLAWLGHWPECKSLEDFHFCTTVLRLNMSIGIIPPLMKWGLCLPSECGETDVANSMTEIINRLEYDELNTLNPEVRKVQCATFPARPYDAGFYCTVILCCVTALLMISGALFEVHLDRQKKKREDALEDSEALLLLRHDSKQNGYGASKVPGEQQKEDREGCCARFLLCFSFTRNLKQILKTDTKGGNMLCLNGIRVISMTWVILGHTLMLVYQVFGATWDGIFGLDFLKSFPAQAILNAFPSVDSFFVLSGLLLTYITLGRMSRSDGRIPWAMFYFHRYWRLLPGLGAAMLFALYLRPYMGEGPLWANSAHYTFNCDKYWWTNLLYINNFYPKSVPEGCIYWVWYLANDMQFYIISPIFLVSLFRKPVVGMIIIAGLCIASFATTIGLMVVNDFKVALMGFGMSDHNGKDIISTVYDKPYCRITPYLVGIVLGYAFHSWRGKRIRINKIAVVVGWASALTTGLAVVYGLYGEFNGSPLSTAENAIYMAFSHFAWAIALSWVIFACHYGYGGWINDFLSWKAWIPLCRLTYGAYLFHPLIMHIFVGNTAHAYSLNAVYIAYYFTSGCVFSYLVSLLVSLGFELPLANLEGFIM
eukprot:XP_001198703.2 PREDICTED: nose resistant to fluoxetine protein 6 [Strongylocentrotus purpuratus]